MAFLLTLILSLSPGQYQVVQIQQPYGDLDSCLIDLRRARADGAAAGVCSPVRSA